MVSKEDFKKEVWKLASEINAKPKQIRIRSMSRKFGSCSPSKIITFNRNLLDTDYSTRKEAILHELLHLRYKNHGKLFKMTLIAYMKLEIY